jgi:hypothetical protein
MGGANGWGLRRVDPNSGNVLWNYSPWPSNGMSPPSVGPNGSVYFSRSLAYLDSVTPNGQLRWAFSDGSIIDHPAVSPNGSIVVAGNRPNFGEPGSARGWDASTGALKWQVNLPNENGGYQIVYTQPRFSADSGLPTSAQRFSPEATSTRTSTRWTRGRRPRSLLEGAESSNRGVPGTGAGPARPRLRREVS